MLLPTMFPQLVDVAHNTSFTCRSFLALCTCQIFLWNTFRVCLPYVRRICALLSANFETITVVHNVYTSRTTNLYPILPRGEGESRDNNPQPFAYMVHSNITHMGDDHRTIVHHSLPTLERH